MSEQIHEAIAAAQRWLAVVDEQKFAESWDKAARAAKSQMPQKDWIASFSSIRAPLGLLTDRALLRHQQLESPEAPGESSRIAVQFSARSGEAQVLETLTLILEDTWRVAGYFVRPV